MSTLRQRDVISHINVSPHELEQFLAREQTAAANDEFNVSHILLSLPEAATPQQLEDISHKAQDLAARAAKGEDFGQLAIANSNSQTALGRRRSSAGARARSCREFILELVTKMKPGEVSAPVRTPERLSHREAQRAAQRRGAGHHQSNPRPAHSDEDRTSWMTTRRCGEKLAKLRERILEGRGFRRHCLDGNSADPGSAPDGGDLGWSGPGTFVPEFDKAIADLKLNEISEPFKTRYGWHIVQMLGTRTYDSTDDVRRQKAFAAIRESKADEETELWLRRLARRAFVEIKM